jgi:hypothetical protein
MALNQFIVEARQVVPGDLILNSRPGDSALDSQPYPKTHWIRVLSVSGQTSGMVCIRTAFADEWKSVTEGIAICRQIKSLEGHFPGHRRRTKHP